MCLYIWNVFEGSTAQIHFYPIEVLDSQYTSEIQHDLQDPNFEQGAFIQKYGKNFNDNIVTIKEFAKDGLERRRAR